MAELAIDPGIKTGGALGFGSGEPPIVFLIERPTAHQTYRIVRRAKELAAARGEKLGLVVEDQHLARHEKANPASTIHLARSAERWVFVAELLGAHVTRVQPASWRTELSPVSPVDDAGEKLTPKQRARILVPRLWSSLELCRGELGSDPLAPCPTDELPLDTVEAIVMGRWRLVGDGKHDRRAPKKRKS